MTLDQYARHMGAVVANLQSLEFALGAVLQTLPNARPTGIARGTDIYAFPVGHELPESEITSYDTLRVLIDKYNDEANKRNAVPIDRSVIDLRDALAYGRVSAEITSDTLRLIKFSKPKAGRVTITFNALLNEEWFAEQKRRTVLALQCVVQHWPQASLGG